MIYTDGKPTICSKGTQIRGIGIRNYPYEKDRPKVTKIDVTKLSYEEKQKKLNEFFEGR